MKTTTTTTTTTITTTPRPTAGAVVAAVVVVVVALTTTMPASVAAAGAGVSNSSKVFPWPGVQHVAMRAMFPEIPADEQLSGLSYNDDTRTLWSVTEGGLLALPYDASTRSRDPARAVLRAPVLTDHGGTRDLEGVTLLPFAGNWSVLVTQEDPCRLVAAVLVHDDGDALSTNATVEQRIEYDCEALDGLGGLGNGGVEAVAFTPNSTVDERDGGGLFWVGVQTGDVYALRLEDIGLVDTMHPHAGTHKPHSRTASIVRHFRPSSFVDFSGFCYVGGDLARADDSAMMFGILDRMNLVTLLDVRTGSVVGNFQLPPAAANRDIEGLFVIVPSDAREPLQVLLADDGDRCRKAQQSNGVWVGIGVSVLVWGIAVAALYLIGQRQRARDEQRLARIAAAEHDAGHGFDDDVSMADMRSTASLLSAADRSSSRSTTSTLTAQQRVTMVGDLDGDLWCPQFTRLYRSPLPLLVVVGFFIALVVGIVVAIPTALKLQQLCVHLDSYLWPAREINWALHRTGRS